MCLKLLPRSDHTNVIDDNESFFDKSKESQKEVHWKYPISTINEGYLFTIRSARPIHVANKTSIATDNEATHGLVKGRKVKSDI